MNQPALFDAAQTQETHCPVGYCQAIRLAGQTGQLPTCQHDLDREHGRKRPRGCLNATDPAHTDWGGF